MYFNLEAQLIDNQKILKSQKYIVSNRRSRDGYSANDFHNKCDNKGKTLTIVRSERGNIFGGFADCEWTSRDLTVRDGLKKSFVFAVNAN